MVWINAKHSLRAEIRDCLSVPLILQIAVGFFVVAVVDGEFGRAAHGEGRQTNFVHQINSAASIGLRHALSTA